jgi:hypothetical protein
MFVHVFSLSLSLSIYLSIYAVIIIFSKFEAILCIHMCV